MQKNKKLANVATVNMHIQYYSTLFAVEQYSSKKE